MTDFKKCMDDAVAAGLMDKGRARQAQDAFDLYSEDLDPRAAQEKVVAEAAAVANAQQRRIEANAKAQQRIDAAIEGGTRLSNLVQDRNGSGSMSGRHKAIRSRLRGDMSKILLKFRSNIIGQRRNKATLRNLVETSYGKKVNDPAAVDLHKAWQEVSRLAAEMYEAAGGFARYKGARGLPQSHNHVSVGKVPAEEWADFVADLIDENELRNDLGERVSPAEARQALLTMHEHIASGGWHDRDRSQVGGAYAVGERRIDPDFLPFKDGGGWMAYAERFGNQADPWRVMVSYIDNMSHQIAEADILGVDADAMWEYAKDKYRRTHRNSDKAKSEIAKADDMRSGWSGVTQEPANRLFARSMSGTRQFLSSFQLGSAVLSSASDFATQRSAAMMLGLNKNGHLKMLGRLMRSKEFRDGAREMSLILENAVDMGSAAMRYSMEDFTVETAARLSDFTMRSTFLSGLTQMQRDAHGMSVQNDIAKLRGEAFAGLPPRLQKSFEGYGIDAAAWDKMRGAGVHEVQGTPFLRPKEVEEAAGRDVSMAYLEMVANTQDRAILTASTESQALVRGKTQPGSLSGEFVRTVAQYKSFPIEYLFTVMNDVQKLMAEGDNESLRGLAAQIIVGTTIAGAVALQLKELSKGKNPRDMDTLEFWTAAQLQGGGLGIFGDFLFADVNRFGGGVGETFSGPTVGLIDDVARLTVGNARELALGEDTKFAKEATQFAAKSNPFNSIWWARLAVDRTIEDQLMKIVDPDAYSGFRRKQRKAEKEGNGYWWRPGQLAPN